MAVTARNNSLTVVEKDKSMSADFYSQLIDFNEMNTIAIQAITQGTDATDGTFLIQVSLICDESSFVTLEGSSRELGTCANFGWEYRLFPWRYARVCYVANSTTTGTVTIYARGRRT